MWLLFLSFCHFNKNKIFDMIVFGSKAGLVVHKETSSNLHVSHLLSCYSKYCFGWSTPILGHYGCVPFLLRNRRFKRPHFPKITSRIFIQNSAYFFCFFFSFSNAQKAPSFYRFTRLSFEITLFTSVSLLTFNTPRLIYASFVLEYSTPGCC